MQKKKAAVIILILIFSVYFSTLFHEIGHYISSVQLGCESHIDIEPLFFRSNGGCTETFWNALTIQQQAYVAAFGPLFSLILALVSSYILFSYKLDYKKFFLFFFLAAGNYFIVFYNAAAAIAYVSPNAWFLYPPDFYIVAHAYGISSIFFALLAIAFAKIIYDLFKKSWKKLKLNLK